MKKRPSFRYQAPLYFKELIDELSYLTSGGEGGRTPNP